MYRLRILVFILFSTVFFQSYGQNVSNEGTDFWTVFPSHIASGNSGTTTTNHAELAVFVTSKSQSEVIVTCGSYSSGITTIPANTAVQFNVTWAQAYINAASANQNLINKGIHIKVSEGKSKVSVYTHIYGAARSAASLILPFETLGQNYYSMNYTQNGSGFNFLTMVAVEANTKLLLHKKDGTTSTITLANAGDVYEYMPTSTDDLTGVYVETDPESACKRFAAFSGSSAIVIACNSSQDPLYQQLYPTSSWGKNYGIVPFINRKYILRILALENNTRVTYNGSTYTVNKGAYIESGQLSESTFITADKLISVAQYSLTQECSSANGGSAFGDPEMVILNPIEFNIKGVTVFSSNLQSILNKYLNVLIRTDKLASFKINGIAPSTSWKTLLGNADFSYTQIDVSSQSLTLTADDGFNAIAYGFGDHESYAYSAGTNLSSNNYLSVINKKSLEEGQYGCVNELLQFNISLPYETDYISWVLDNGNPIPQNPSVLVETKVVGGQTLYIYKSPFEKTFPSAGQHRIDVVTHVPNTSSCITGNVSGEYTFGIYELPTAKFEAVEQTCTQSEILLIDKSTSNADQFTISNWLWDFGDGSEPSTLQNPKHQYEKPGSYSIKLSVKSSTGCYSDVYAHEIEVYALPQSSFSMPANGCVNSEVVFTDNTTLDNSKNVNVITFWKWDFGDGTMETKTTNAPFTHVYTKSGNYEVSLYTTSSSGCGGITYIKTITINDLPTPNFILPDVCSSDGLTTFKNTSVDAVDGNGILTYKWNFGDPTGTASPNTSTDKDGKHQYVIPGPYTVTLTTTNTNGCEFVSSKSFVVNGRVDKAEFTVHNPENLCSNNDVIITSGFTALIGKLVKLEIYKDYNPNGTNTIYKTVMYPNNVDDIALTYDAFGGNTDRKYTIRIVGFTGDNAVCTKEAIQVISLKPAPQISFKDFTSICENDGTVSFTNASETSGIIGTGGYSTDGKGLTADGLFNPKVAGIGLHNITYTFKAGNSCELSITKTIEVYKSPIADAGQTLYILAGGQITIPATAEGANLKYEWSPALGLDKIDVLNPLASPEKDTQYTLSVTTQPDGCISTSTVLIKVLQALNPPNTFTPNGDNVNDTWIVKYLESYPNATVEVFNRNGNRVFFSNGYKVPFDGNYQNGPLPVGVYYYIINPRNGRKSVTGPLTIIR